MPQGVSSSSLALTCAPARHPGAAPGMNAPPDKGLQPVKMGNWPVFFYFVAFVVVVSYTLLNLYIGERARAASLTPAPRAGRRSASLSSRGLLHANRLDRAQETETSPLTATPFIPCPLPCRRGVLPVQPHPLPVADGQLVSHQ